MLLNILGKYTAFFDEQFAVFAHPVFESCLVQMEYVVDGAVADVRLERPPDDERVVERLGVRAARSERRRDYWHETAEDQPRREHHRLRDYGYKTYEVFGIFK